KKYPLYKIDLSRKKGNGLIIKFIDGSSKHILLDKIEKNLLDWGPDFQRECWEELFNKELPKKCTGNQFEEDRSKIITDSHIIRKDSFWNSSIIQKSRFYFKSYDSINKWIKKNLPNNSKIIDCGSGKGALLGMLEKTKKYKCWGIEKNKPSAKQSQKKLTSKVIQGDLCELKEIIEKHKELKNPNCLIFSGILTREVISKQNALKILKTSKQCLANNGVIIITGFAPNYFNSNDYKKMGFKVINTYDPNNQIPLWVIQPYNPVYKYVDGTRYGS
ncbi:methionine biosynthesis protein MetW, partial [Candidatus Margulisiibacteriota bacterium]